MIPTDTIAHHPTPSWGAVLREQFLSVGVAIRREWTVVLSLICVINALGAWAARRQGQAYDDGITGMLLMVAATLQPFSVWRSASPSRRTYHAAMPVSYPIHTLIRTAMGWLWLMMAIIVCLAVNPAFNIVLNGMVAQQQFNAHAIMSSWVSAWTAPTIVYLLLSIVVIASDHPWRWIGACIFGDVLGAAIAAVLRWKTVAAALSHIILGPYGLANALFKSPFLSNSTIEISTDDSGGAMTPLATLLGDWSRDHWHAILLWMSIGLVGTILVSYRQRRR